MLLPFGSVCCFFPCWFSSESILLLEVLIFARGLKHMEVDHLGVSQIKPPDDSIYQGSILGSHV